MKRKKSKSGWYFLGIVVFMYIILFGFAPYYANRSISASLKIASTVIPVLVLVFGIMLAFEYFMTPESIKMHLSKSSGTRRWLISVVAGILSSGPVYVWYPLLSKMKEKGISYGFVATFLYNRAVKFPLLPIMIIYFGIKYTAVLTMTMVAFSLVQGFIFEKLEDIGLL